MAKFNTYYIIFRNVEISPQKNSSKKKTLVNENGELSRFFLEFFFFKMKYLLDTEMLNLPWCF
jgi:hypothetical protein